MEEFQKYFFLDHFSPSFLGQKLYFLDTDSILRVKKMYKSVKQDVIKWKMVTAQGSDLKIWAKVKKNLTQNIFWDYATFRFSIRYECKIEIQIICHWSTAFHTSFVRGNNHTFLPVFDVFSNPFTKKRFNLKKK